MDKPYVQHVGGLAALIKLLGPSCVRDSLAKDVTLGAVGSIVSYMYFIENANLSTDL